MSYYREIEGVQYDRALLEMGENLTRGKGDGRVSKADAEQLLHAARDGGRITPIELQTLNYLSHHLTWTDPAKEWLEQKLYHPEITDIQAEIEKILRTDYQIAGLQADIPTEAVQAQSKPESAIPFNVSLLQALDAIFTYDQHSDAPAYIIRQIHGIEADENFAWREKTTPLIRQYLRTGKLYLLQGIEEDTPPENESLSDNWIYYLHLPELSDHQFWIVIDRSGEREGYVYGGN